MLSLICEPCRAGNHAECPSGTHCFCQHKAKKGTGAVKESWEISRAAVRWHVIRVRDCGVVAGVHTKPFRVVERVFWRYNKALAYVLSREVPKSGTSSQMSAWRYGSLG